jgi:hypothetical protein
MLKNVTSAVCVSASQLTWAYGSWADAVVPTDEDTVFDAPMVVMRLSWRLLAQAKCWPGLVNVSVIFTVLDAAVVDCDVIVT